MAAASVPPRAEALVGATVAVWWGGDDAWYTGTVAKYCSSDKGGKNAGRHWIKYADGDKKWHLLDYPFYEVRAASILSAVTGRRGHRGSSARRHG